MKIGNFKFKILILEFKIIFLFFFPLWGGQRGAAQDIHTSQPNNYPLLYNPASTGLSGGDFRLNGGYKDQWRNITTPYKTFIMSGDMALLKEKSEKEFLGFGATVIRDMAGDAGFGLTQLHISVAAAKPFSENHKISAGLQGGFAQRTLDGEKFQWGSQFDGEQYNASLASGEPLLSDAFFFSDFAGGVLWSMDNHNNLEIRSGLALHHLNRPKQYFYLDKKNLYSRFSVHGSGIYRITGSATSLLPSFLIDFQGPSREINAGMLIQRTLGLQPTESSTGETAIGLGAMYRAGDAFILAARLQLKDIVVGLSYDINISGLSIASRGWGGAEISFVYTHHSKEKEDNPQIHKF